jgi:hypothetical protein
MNGTCRDLAHPRKRLLRLFPGILLFLSGNVLLPVAGNAASPIYSGHFSRGQWNSADWVRVKNPRAEHFGDWVQHDDCITNEVPKGAIPSELQGKLATETYSSMAYKEKVTGNVTIRSTMSFAHEMAPLIVLAPELRENARGQKEYREHFEIVIFNEGVNVWHHFVEDGRLPHRKAAFARFPLEKDTKYVLEVKKTGRTLTISVAGHAFGYIEDALPESFYVGITGCEGLNRFYDFTVSK